MYVCGVSSGFNWPATNAAGSAGGVRRAVAAGTWVSVGTAVPVGCSCAKAVWKACVRAALMSAVGAEAGAGWQALRRVTRRKKKEGRRNRGVVIIRLFQKWTGKQVYTVNLQCKPVYARFYRRSHSFPGPSIKASTFSRQTSPRNCWGGDLKK